MAVTIQPIVVSTNTFLDWVKTTNTIIDIISSNTVTTGGIPAVGDAVITGSLQADTLYADTISGGALGLPATLTLNTNTSFTAPATFSGNVALVSSNTFLGNFANVMVDGANTTHNTVGIDPVTSKLVLKQIPDFTLTGATANAVVYWDGTNVTSSNVIMVDVSSNTVTFANTIILSDGLKANNSLGAAGEVLTSNGSAAYWASVNTSPLLHRDTVNSRVGINTTTPSTALQVIGTITANAAIINGGAVWTNLNDGTGSGLDADLLDGLDSNGFIKKNVAETTTGVITFSNGIKSNKIDALTPIQDIIITANNVGIGQTVPNHKLDISGNIRATGNSFFGQNSYFGTPGATNKVGVLDLLKESGSTLTGNTTISTSGQKINFFENGGTQRGAYIDLSTTGAGVTSQIWHTQGAIASLGATSATSGWQKMPSGLIFQWGRSGSLGSNSNRNITFPIPYTVACFGVQTTPLDSGDMKTGITSNPTTTGFTIRNDDGNVVDDIMWFAYGV